MTCCLFAGPTLRESDRARFPDAVWLPPARQGDVYRAAVLLQPRFIGIVDGYFQWVPAVWHKEILWAIEQGIHVFGAASMGALRAAELEPYGMRGVGRIFAAYRTGVLAPFDEAFEDDDEVAVVHGPGESGYLPGSEALVNIRVTLAEAWRANVIPAATLRSLCAIGKRLFFPDRSYERILREARATDIPAQELDALEAFLPRGRIDQKRADALELIGALQTFRAADPARAQARFRFEHTSLWDRVVRSLAHEPPHEETDERVLAEARLEGPRFVELYDEVLALLTNPDARASVPDGPSSVHEENIAACARSHVWQRIGAQVPRALVERHVLQRLNSDGRYAGLLARSEDKRERLQGIVLAVELGLLDGVQLLQLEDWFFGTCLGADMPEDLTLWIAQAGYTDRRMFHEAILGEYLYRRGLSCTGS